MIRRLLSPRSLLVCVLGLDEHATYRRWWGGHWESWYNDYTHSDCWYSRPSCSRPDGVEVWRPGMGRGSPTCEDW